MTQLTWKNVDAPNFSGVSQSQALTAQLLSKGLGSIGATLDSIKSNRQQTTDQDYLANIARFSNPEELNGYMQTAQASGVSPEAIKYGMERSTKLLGNQGLDIANDTNQWNLSQAQRNDAQAQDRLAAQPAAAKLLADVRTLSGSGDAASVEKARSLLSGNTQTLINAGYNADAIPGLLDAERGAGTAGFGYKKEVLENSKFWENQGITEQARTIAQKRINENYTPEAGIRSIQDDQEITDPRVKAQAIQVIQQAADSKVFSQPDPSNQLLASLGIQPTAAPRAGSSNSNPLVGLIDQTEGGGRYDTLFGHAQKGNGAFAGVDVSKQTIGQLKQFASADGAYGRHQKAKLGYLATPMGRFQIVGQTLSRTAEEMGLPDDTVFDANTQNAMFNHLVDKRLSGPRTMSGKIEGLRQEWEGFKNVSNEALSAAITAYEAGDKGVFTNLAQGSGSDSVAQNYSSPRISQPVGISPAAQLIAAAAPTSDPAAVAATSPAATPAGDPVSAALDAAQQTEPPTSTLNLDRTQSLDDYLSGFGVPGSAIAAGTGPVISAEAAQLAAAPIARPTGVNPATQVQTALDQNILDRIFNRNGALIEQVVDQKYANETPAQTATRLVGEGGSMPSGNQQAVLAAINETIQMAGGKLAPHVAGAIVANNAESRDLTSWLPFGLGDGDRFAKEGESNTAATRTNMEGVAEDLKQLGASVSGAVDLAAGTSQIQNQRASGVSIQQLAQIQGALLAASAEAANIQAAIQNGQDSPANRTALAQKVQLIQQLETALQQIGRAQGPTTTFSRAASGTPQ